VSTAGQAPIPKPQVQEHDMWAYWRGSVDERLKTVETTGAEVRVAIRDVRAELGVGVHDLKQELTRQTSTLQADIKDQIKQTYKLMGGLALLVPIVMFVVGKLFGVK